MPTSSCRLNEYTNKTPPAWTSVDSILLCEGSMVLYERGNVQWQTTTRNHDFSTMTSSKTYDGEYLLRVAVRSSHQIWQSLDQPGIVAHPPRGQPNRENECSPVPIRAWEFGLTRCVRPSRPAPTCSFSTLRLNLVLTHGFLPISAAAFIYLFISQYAIRSIPSLSGHATASRWRSLPRVR